MAKTSKKRPAKKAKAQFEMPPARIPDPEPAEKMPVEDWHKIIPGSPAEPVQLGDRTWSAGGLVRFTLCVDEDGNPRCYYCQPDMTCSGPPNEQMRMTMTSCIGYRPKF